MSQKASTHLIIPEPSDDLIASEPWSIETYADGLMDDLFTDIDQIFEETKKLPSQRTPPGYVSVDTSQISQIVWAGKAVPQGSHNQVSALVVDNPATRKVVRKRRLKKSQGWFSRLIFVTFTLGLAIAGITWVFNSGVFRFSAKSWQTAIQKPQAVTQPPQPTKAEIEANLADYMLGALTAIERQEVKNQNKPSQALLTAGTRTNQTALAYLRESAPGSLPAPRAANNTIPAPSRSSRVVERIYIPVYQAPLPMRYAPPAIPGVANAQTLPPLPPQPQGNTATQQPSPPVKTAANPQSTNPSKLKPVAVKSSPVAVSQAKQPPKLPSIPSTAVAPKPPAAAPAKPEPPEPKTPQKEIVSASVATSAHILTGLLENGEKSQALFKINGADRRIQVGENIGSSGWTLVDVANGEAIIRRNGEVRSIFAGQKF